MSVTINASTSTGLVQSADTSGEIELQSNGTTALKVNTNEGIQILNCLGVGNATPSTSGAGITFPATQSASTDANTLDDYEEGTWTPTGNGITLTNNGSFYTKIGRLVYISADITFPNTANGSAADIGGLPFTVSSTSGGGGITLGYTNRTSGFETKIWNFGTNGTSLNAYGTSNINSGWSTFRIIINGSYTV